MKPTLILQPIHNSSADILKSFALGKVLTPDQTHFLDWSKHQLSSPSFDPVLTYYLQHLKTQRQAMGSFLLPSEELNKEAIEQFKKRLQLYLEEKYSQVEINFSMEQFLQFKELTIQELIFWHGNQFLTGAPFFPGGLPLVIYFHWGNLFGIAKSIVLPEEKLTKGNRLLVEFEAFGDRNLDQCVEQYQHRLSQEMQTQRELLVPKEIPAISSSLSPFKLPELTLSHYYLINEAK